MRCSDCENAGLTHDRYCSCCGRPLAPGEQVVTMTSAATAGHGEPSACESCGGPVTTGEPVCLVCARVFGRVLDALQLDGEAVVAGVAHGEPALDCLEDLPSMREEPTAGLPTTAESVLPPAPITDAGLDAPHTEIELESEVVADEQVPNEPWQAPWWVAPETAVPATAPNFEPAPWRATAEASAPPTPYPGDSVATAVAADAADAAPAEPAPWWEVGALPTAAPEPLASANAGGPAEDAEGAAPSPWWMASDAPPVPDAAALPYDGPSPAAFDPQFEPGSAPAPWWASSEQPSPAPPPPVSFTATPEPETEAAPAPWWERPGATVASAPAPVASPAPPSAYAAVPPSVVSAAIDGTEASPPPPVVPPPLPPVLVASAPAPTMPTVVHAHAPKPTARPARASRLSLPKTPWHSARASRAVTYTAMLGIVVALGVPAMQFLPWPGAGVAPSTPSSTAAPLPEVDLTLPSTDSVMPPSEAPPAATAPASAPAAVSSTGKPERPAPKPTPAPSAAMKAKNAATLAARKLTKEEPAPVAVVPVQPAFAVSRAEFAPTPAAEPADVPDDTAVTGPFYEVRQVDVRPQVESQVAPSVPEHLRGRGVKDVVVLRVRVTPAGRAADVQVLRRSSVDAALDAAAVAAVKKWRFSPARRRGQAVNCWFSVGVSIKGEGEDKGGH